MTLRGGGGEPMGDTRGASAAGKQGTERTGKNQNAGGAGRGGEYPAGSDADLSLMLYTILSRGSGASGGGAAAEAGAAEGGESAARPRV